MGETKMHVSVLKIWTSEAFNHLQVGGITCSAGFASAIYIQGWLQAGCHLYYRSLSTNETPGFRP